MTPMRASDRARQRLKEELAAHDISQSELAEMLTTQTGETWTKSKVAHVLNGHVQLLMDDADAIAKVVKLYLTEVCRDRGLEFYAEMSPTELRMLEKMRKRPAIMHAVMMLLDMKPMDSISDRRPKPKLGGPLKSASKLTSAGKK